MKKVISFLIAIMMMSTTVLADAADDVRELLVKQATFNSFTSKTVFDIDVNEPLEILDYIPSNAYSNIDYALMINDLTDAEITVNCAYNVSEDYKKLQMAMDCEFDVPVHINDSFKLDAWAKIGMWYNYDVTDAENPVFEVIVKTPLDSTYVVGDLAKEYKTDMSSFMNVETVKHTAEIMADAITKNASITKTSKGYNIKFDNDGFCGLINDWMSIAGEYLADDEKKEFESAMKELGNIFSGISFLGKNGMTASVTRNSKGEITACIEEMHVDFNVYDMLEAGGKSTDGLEREKAQIDLTLRAATEISGINTTKVTLPELTPENTTQMFAEYTDDYYYTEKAPLFRNNIIYYPVNEVIELTRADVKIEGNKVTVGETVLECDQTQLITYEDGIYVTKDVLEFIGVYYTDIEYDVDEGVFTFTFEYSEDSTGIAEEYNDEEPYISPYLEIDFELDRGLYTYNGIAYMPVYEFVSQMYEGEFAFGYKSLVYTAKNINVHGIETLSVRDGDSFVTVNGNKISIEAPAREINGVLNIPISFAAAYGYSGTARTTHFTYSGVRTEFYFSQKNPLYDWDEEETYRTLWVSSDRLPHIENGEVCVPMYDLLLEMYDGAFSFTENGMEYTAAQTNEYGITTISVTVGDNFVTVDGEKVELENKVVRVDDVIRVPMEFAEKLGFESDGISVYGGGSTYWFVMSD